MCWIQQAQQTPPSFPETKAQRGGEGSPVTGWLGESRTRPDGQLQQFQRPHVTVPFLDISALIWPSIDCLQGTESTLSQRLKKLALNFPHTQTNAKRTRTHTLSQRTLVGFYLDSMVGGLMAGASRPWRSVVRLGKATSTPPSHSRLQQYSRIPRFSSSSITEQWCLCMVQPFKDRKESQYF